ncbi:MAG: hydroxypyruvate isomerase, partial [Rhizobacter sp.]|nr:hydroxypyruvate isomerase [Rhizobacter sp.]
FHDDATDARQMPQFSANISMLFTERPMLERPLAAREAGFDGIEIQFPYEHPIGEWQAALADSGLPLVLFNLSAGDMTNGGPGLAAMPGREPIFKAAIGEALRYACELQPQRVNVLAGSPPESFDTQHCLEVLAANLAMAARAFEPLGVGVTVEAINSFDRPGYLISTSLQALELIDFVDHPNLSLQHDLYHMQMMEGRLVSTLEELLPRIGHLQFADTPGRHEPGTGEIRFDHLFTAIDRLGYTGFVGAEYVPSRRTEETLGWLAAARNAGSTAMRNVGTT